MAKDIRSLVIDEGVTKQVGNDDTLQVGVGIKPSTGTALQIGAVDTDVSVPGSMTIDGDLDVQGAIGVVSTTTFQQDATFLGNVSFGDADAPVDDTVSFANAKINSDINFNGASPTYKITNLLDPTAGSQEAATAKYVDDGLGLKLDLTGGTMSGAIEMGGSSITGLGAPSGDNDAARKVYVDDGLADKVAKAGDTMTGPLTISNNSDLYIGEDASPGGSLRFYGAFDQDLLVNPSYGVKALQNHLLLDATQNAGTSFGGTVKIGSDASTLAVDIGRVGSTLTVMADLSLNSNKITSLADPTAAQEAATKNYADGHLGGVAYTFPASDGSAGQVLKTDGNGELSWEADVSAPAGNDTEVQFNNAGVFGADSKLTFNATNGVLSITADAAAVEGPLRLSNVDGLFVDTMSTEARLSILNPLGSESIDLVAANGVLVNNGTGGSIKMAALPWFLIEATDSMNLQVVNFDGAIGMQTGGVDHVLIGGNDGGGMAYLQTQNGVRLETKGEFWMAETATLPAGVANTGKLAAKSNALYFVDATGQAHYTMPDGLLALSGSSSVELDFDPELPSYRDLPLSDNTTFSTAGLAAGRSMSIRLDNSAGGSARVLTFPNTSGTPKWKWLGGSAPAQVAAGDVAVISLVCYGTTDESIVAAWSYSESVQITGSGTAGEVAYFDGTRTIKSEGGLKWDEANDRLNIGNADNGTHSANLRVGGSAHIGGEVFLDGNVDLGDAAADVITVNGAMSLAAGASFDGTAGTVDLPAQFSIDGSAVSANVTAANLNTLTGGGDTTLHSHGSMVVDGLTAAGGGSAPAQYDACYISANDTIAKGDQTDLAKSVIAGIRSSATNAVIITSGRATANFVSGLAGSLAGKPCYLAGGANAGKLTTTPPSSGVQAEIGVVLSDANYGTAGTCSVSLAIKPTIQLA